MTERSIHSLNIVRRMEDIPPSSSEAEEHAFWSEHELDEALWEIVDRADLEVLPLPRPRISRAAG